MFLRITITLVETLTNKYNYCKYEGCELHLRNTDIQYLQLKKYSSLLISSSLEKNERGTRNSTH